MKRLSSIQDIEPLPQRWTWHSHKKIWLDSTFLPHRKRKHKKAPRHGPTRHRAPIWDKYLIVEDLLQQTKRREMTVSLYKYRYRHTRFGFRRHIYKIKWNALKQWKTQYSRPKEMAKLRKAWLKVVKESDTKTKNILKKRQKVLKTGRAPIMEEFLHWKIVYRGQLSMDKSFGWFKRELKRVVNSPIHFTILQLLFDPEKDEARVWRTLKFSWGFLNRVKVCVLYPRF